MKELLPPRNTDIAAPTIDIPRQPLVSIVIPCYNHESFVQQAIQSVINQDYDNIELIIIDDGSKDDSVLKIEEMRLACQARFKRFELRQRPNKGLSATLNEALEWCEGEFFAPIASDDVLNIYKTSTQVKYLQRHLSSAGVFGGVDSINSEGVIIKNRKKSLSKLKKYHFKDIFLQRHNLPAPSQLLRLATVRNAGGYNYNLILEDWSMWLFLTQEGSTLDYIDGVFASYRRHDDNLSSKFEKMMAGRVQVLNLFADHSLYRRALAQAHMVNAHDWQKSNTSKSISALKKALDISRSILISPSFIKYCIKSVRLNR